MDVNILPGNTSMGRAIVATGTFTSDDTLVAVTLGFTPRVVELVNATTAARYLKTDTMAAAVTYRQLGAADAAGVAMNAVTLVEGGFTLTAAAAGDAQVIHFVAYA